MHGGITSDHMVPVIFRCSHLQKHTVSLSSPGAPTEAGSPAIATVLLHFPMTYVRSLGISLLLPKF